MSFLDEMWTCGEIVRGNVICMDLLRCHSADRGAASDLLSVIERLASTLQLLMLLVCQTAMLGYVTA
jgi:hypothetical protein